MDKPESAKSLGKGRETSPKPDLTRQWAERSDAEASGTQPVEKLGRPDQVDKGKGRETSPKPDLTRQWAERSDAEASGTQPVEKLGRSDQVDKGKGRETSPKPDLTRQWAERSDAEASGTQPVEKLGRPNRVGKIREEYNSHREAILSLKSELSTYYASIKEKLKEHLQVSNLEGEVEDSINLNYQMQKVKVPKSVNEETFENTADGSLKGHNSYFSVFTSLIRNKRETELKAYTSNAETERIFLETCKKNAENINSIMDDIGRQREWFTKHQSNNSVYRREQERVLKSLDASVTQTLILNFHPGIFDAFDTKSDYTFRFSIYAIKLNTNASELASYLDQYRNLQDKHEIKIMLEEFSKMHTKVTNSEEFDMSKSQKLLELSQQISVIDRNIINADNSIDARSPYKNQLASVLQAISQLDPPPGYEEE